MHELNLSAEWPRGPKGKKHYRATCTCGWKSTSCWRWIPAAEEDFEQHLLTEDK